MTDQGPPSPCSSSELFKYLEDCNTSSPSRCHKCFGCSKDKILNYIFFKSPRDSDEDSVLSCDSSKSLNNSEKCAKCAKCSLPPFFSSTELHRGSEDNDLPLSRNSSKSVKFPDDTSLRCSAQSLKKSEDSAASLSHRGPRSPAGNERETSSSHICPKLSSTTSLSCGYKWLRDWAKSISPVSSCCSKSLECSSDCSSPPCDCSCVQPPCNRKVYKKKPKRLECRCMQKYKIWKNYVKERRNISKKIMKKTGKTYCNLLLNSFNDNHQKQLVQNTTNNAHSLCPDKLQECPGRTICSNFSTPERTQTTNFPNCNLQKKKSLIKCSPRKRSRSKSKCPAKRTCFKANDIKNSIQNCTITENVGTICGKSCSQNESIPRQQKEKLNLDNTSIQNSDCDAKNFSEIALKLYQNLDECHRKTAKSYIIKFLSDTLLAQFSKTISAKR